MSRVKWFLKKLVLGSAVFFGFAVVGYFVVGPRLEFGPNAWPRLSWAPKHTKNDSQTKEDDLRPSAELTASVEVFERVGKDSYQVLGERQVAPYSYDRFSEGSRRPKPETPEEPAEPEDEPLIIDRDGEPEPTFADPEAPMEPAPIEPPKKADGDGDGE
ncbi:MAG: hypothetical protein HUU60_06005 [Armatimonadetes bacterium]|nr:hypothetical protein [Armatimonadota bacterium]